MRKSSIVNEELFESSLTSRLIELGWVEIKDFPRIDNREVLNFEKILSKIKLINNISDELASKAVNEIKKINDEVISMNIIGHKFLTDGIKVYDQSQERHITVWLISKDVNKNDYEIIRQLKISNGSENRIPDIILYVNGLPLVVMELKSPLAIEGLEDAFKQNESLKRHCPKLWTFNIINYLSNNLLTKYGSITSQFKRFAGWTPELDGFDKEPIDFLFNKEMIYKFINLFSFYSNEQIPIKYIAAPHQIAAVNLTMEKLKNSKDNRGGVVWHTQGSGKSVTMVFLTKAINMYFDKPTVLMVTDRNTLDQQLFQRFLNAESFLRNKSVSISSRKDLINQLENKKHFGIYFTTVQKFVEETGILSNREDIFILVDEAHRTQNNLDGNRQLDKAKEELVVKFGYARFMRDAFPNAKITGFTGTPLMGDKTTEEIFGSYNHKYSMNDAVFDGATVPLQYELRKPKITLNENYLQEMDDLQTNYLKTLNPNDIASQQKIDTLLKSVRLNEVLEDEEVIKYKAKDIIKHLKKRSCLLNGKALIVANSRNAAYLYYKTINETFPEYGDKIILVVTENNKDLEEMSKAITKKTKINEVAAEFRKPNSQYKIAIVVDMWLTGFDVPDLDVMYLDKIIKWHNLMQAIARVNRTFEDVVTGKTKESGLIVDYIGIWKFLSDALMQYETSELESFDLKIEDILKSKNQLHDLFDIIEDNYIPDINNFSRLNEKEKYKFVINGCDIVLSLSGEEKGKFIKLARKTKRIFKMAYSVIDEKDSTIAKGIEIINSLVTVSSITGDESLMWTIDRVKEAVKASVEIKTTDIEITETKISKNINEVSKLLLSEAKLLIKESPRVAVEMMKHSLESQINQMQRIRPHFAKKASDKLRDIINNLQKMEDVQKVVEMLRQLAKEINDENNKTLEFDEPQLQAFFEVISNDEYLSHNNNSEVLKKLAEELMSEVKINITEQFMNNPKAKTKVVIALKKLLKNKYNYPPEELGGVSGILINQINKEINVNSDYFKRK